MIRLAKHDDSTIKKLVKTDLACFTKDNWSKKQWTSYLLSCTTEVYFIFDSDKKLCGYSAWDVNKISGVVYLASIAILPQYRKHGLAKKLLEYNIEDYTKLEIKSLYAHTRWTNYPSQKLLKGIGFVVNSIVSNYYGDEDGIEFKKVI
jgi:ribosomal protein S18 acetylase RimI-like enzyme